MALNSSFIKIIYFSPSIPKEKQDCISAFKDSGENFELIIDDGKEINITSWKLEYNFKG